MTYRNSILKLLEAVAEALAASVIEEIPQAVSRYQFSHVLIQDTLAREMLAARRARLHRRIAESLEELYGDDIEPHAVELAYHFAQAGTATDREKLVRYSLLAGERALASFAYEEAVGHFQRGLAAKGEGQTDAEGAALLYGLGRGQLATFDPHENHEAVTNLARAFEYYAETKDVDRAVAVAQSPVQSALLTGHDTGVMELVTRAVSLVPIDSLEAGRLLCQYGNTVYYQTGDHEGAMEAFSQAMAIARREGDAALEMRTLVAAGHAEAYHLHFEESLRYDLRAIELASQVDEPFEETHARQEIAAVLHRTGDLAGARRQSVAMLEAAELLRHRTRLLQALQANTVVSFLEGDWQTARSLSDRALAGSPQNPNLLGYRALIEYVTGDSHQGSAYLERLLQTMRRAKPGPTFEYSYPAIVVPLIAHLIGTDIRLEEARAAAQVVLSSQRVTPVLATLARAGLALLVVREGNVNEAGEQYTALRRRSGTMVGGPLDSIIGADRLLGLLAEAIGQPEQADTHFKDALAFCEKAGYRPEWAWTAYEYARCLQEKNGPGDSLMATSLLEQSLTITSELYMGPLRDRVLVLQQQIESRLNQASEHPDGLTEREVTVLRLVTLGKSNSEIGHELLLSVRTVERHITNIYAKIHVRGRADATAYAFSRGLVS